MVLFRFLVSKGHLKRLKLGITPQLIILVGFSSIFSLLILAIVSGVYFSGNLSDLRAERLLVIAQLKSTQIAQAENTLQYQVYSLANKQDISAPLTSFRAGNDSKQLYLNAQYTLDSFLRSSEIFSEAKLYNLNLEVVAHSKNGQPTVSKSTANELFILDDTSDVPPPLEDFSTEKYPTAVTGPTQNSSDPYGEYFLGITLPVYANSSIILDIPQVSGYISVIANAGTIKAAINDTDETYKNSDPLDYNVLMLRTVYDYSNMSDITLSGYLSTFPARSNGLETDVIYNINASSLAKVCFSKSFGSAVHVKNNKGVSSAIGFARIDFSKYNSWIIVIQQNRSKFIEPLRQLKRILIGVVIGIAAFMCIVTFLLAIWFIRPIKKLKKATEEMTRSRKMKNISHEDNTGLSSSVSWQYPDIEASSKRNSLGSIANTSSLHSAAIRLPDKIVNSKKIFKDELTELTDAFNIMIEELDKQYSHLEYRVKLRTKELESSKIEAEAANEAKTVFIANISHELRTPLNGILGMTAIALDENDPSRVHESLKLIYRSGELLLHILTELLTFSKNTLNRSKLEKSNFQLIDIVNQIKSIFGKLAVDQGVSLNIHLKPNIIRKLILFGDSNRIIQVVMNLVSNSLKFTPIYGDVDVIFRLLGQYDEARSAAEGYSKVYVLNSPSKEDEMFDQSTRQNNDNFSSSKSELSVDTKKSEILDNKDSDSLRTITTRQYDNAVFMSQFKDDNVKIAYSSSSSTSSDEKKKTGLKPVISEQTSITEKDKMKNSVDEQQKKVDDSEEHDSSESTIPDEIIINEKRLPIKRFDGFKTWVIQISVRDNGPGIEPALQEKVFDPFIQGDQTLSRSYGGTGLGLSICRQLAKMMNGTLTLNSTLGKGSTFTFTVPLQQTGEILINNSDLKEICDDEFNPLSKINRKIAFSNQNEIVSSDINSEMPDDTSHSSHDSETSEISEMENVDPVPVPIPVSDNIPTQDSIDISSKVSKEENHDFTTRYDERPHLITNTSTGTASSANGGVDANVLSEKFSHIRILVAEDNMVNQEVIKRMLQLEGYTNICMACNGLEAVEFVKQSVNEGNPFQMIFMDVQMPKMDGLLATEVIRNSTDFKNPIIALTAFADKSNVKKCLASGMTGFLSKPINRSNLKKIIAEFGKDAFTEIVKTP